MCAAAVAINSVILALLVTFPHSYSNFCTYRFMHDVFHPGTGIVECISLPRELQIYHFRTPVNPLRQHVWSSFDVYG